MASTGGSEVGRDTHGFVTKIYSRCGNQDLVGNDMSSFLINDGADCESPYFPRIAYMLADL